MLLLVACSHGGKAPDTGDEPPVETLRVEQQTVNSNNHGLFDVDFEVQEGERVQVVLEDPNNGYVGTVLLIDPDGNTALDRDDWYGARSSLTSAVTGAQYASALNWPVREEDGPMAPGTWTLSGEILDRTQAPNKHADVEATVFYRSDDAPTLGAAHVVIAYCTGVRDEDGVVEAIEAGAAYWQELYASWGVTLTVEYADIEVDPALPDTYEGVEAYGELLAGYDDYPLLMIIGDDINGDSYIYGEAAAIPGPMAATRISAVEVSWLAHAGGNGRFSEGEIGILGETMAHETGHYLGMFHPVEDGWQFWDAVDDTPECESMSDCQDELGDNLMFPYPVCTSMVDCAPQDQLTDGQVGIIQRYVGVD